MSPVGLVIAKAPVPGQVKTRLAASVGDVAAAALAAAALADTLESCTAAFDRCWLAVTGDLDEAVGAATLKALLRDWTVVPQRGTGLGQRLANAHQDVGTDSMAPVVQLGMDTPQAGPDLLRGAAEQLTPDCAVLGPAADGGWWVLALPDPQAAGVLATVPMSTAATGDLTRAALQRHGLRVAATRILRDIDEAEDAAAVAAIAPGTRFAAAWRSTHVYPVTP